MAKKESAGTTLIAAIIDSLNAKTIQGNPLFRF